MMLLNPFLWFAVMAITLIGGEVLRSVLDKRRVAKYGLGGTQDVVIIQMFVCYFAIAMLLISACYRYFW